MRKYELTHAPIKQISIPLFLFSLAMVGCSGPKNVTRHGELPASSVIEVTFDKPGSNLLAFKIAKLRIISEDGATTREEDIQYGFKRVGTGETWTHEIDSDRNGLAASFRCHSDIPFTVQLKSKGKVLRDLKSESGKEVLLLAGIVGDETTVDATDMRPSSEQAAHLTQLLEDWLVDEDIQKHLDESFTEAEIHLIKKWGVEVGKAYSPDIDLAVKRVAAWHPDSEEEGVVSFWGALVREGEEEVFMRIHRDKSGTVQKFAIYGPLLDKLSADE